MYFRELNLKDVESTLQLAVENMELYQRDLDFWYGAAKGKLFFVMNFIRMDQEYHRFEEKWNRIIIGKYYELSARQKGKQELLEDIPFE